MHNKVKAFIFGTVQKIKTACKRILVKTLCQCNTTLEAITAEAYVDTGVKVLIAVVLGTLLLTLLYALFNDVIGPTVGDRVYRLFEYAG